MHSKLTAFEKISLTLSLFILLGSITALIFLRLFYNQQVSLPTKDAIAQIATAHNDVRRKSDTSLFWSKAQQQELIQSGDSLFTGEKSTAKVILLGKDGGTISLGPLSVVHIQPNEEGLDLKVTKGSIVGSFKKDSNLNIFIGEKKANLTVQGKNGAQIKISKTESTGEIQTVAGDIAHKTSDIEIKKAETSETAQKHLEMELAQIQIVTSTDNTIKDEIHASAEEESQLNLQGLALSQSSHFIESASEIKVEELLKQPPPPEILPNRVPTPTLPPSPTPTPTQSPTPTPTSTPTPTPSPSPSPTPSPSPSRTPTPSPSPKPTKTPPPTPSPTPTPRRKPSPIPRPTLYNLSPAATSSLRPLNEAILPFKAPTQNIVISWPPADVDVYYLIIESTEGNKSIRVTKKQPQFVLTLSQPQTINWQVNGFKNGQIVYQTPKRIFKVKNN